MESGFLNVFIICLAGYIIGSVPIAYLICKLKYNIDITEEGSGNVGTLNSLKVTKSKAVGIIVLLLDLLKGILPVVIMLFILEIDYGIAMAACACIILGHNYSFWLGFKGGRGLATGAGLYLILNYYIVALWGLVWLISYTIKKNVLISNTVATALIPLYIFLVVKFKWLIVTWNLSSFSIFYFSLFTIVITFIIMLKHIEIFKKNNT